MRDIPEDIAQAAQAILDTDLTWEEPLTSAIARAILAERERKSEAERRIRLRIYNIMEKELGAKSDLLGIIGSWGDSMDDEEVLEALMRRSQERDNGVGAD